MVLASTAGKAAPSPTDRGEYMARASNCISCHSIPHAAPFSGGLKMATPLGAIYATNITPDPETGIGSYSLEDFDRAVRLGVAKDGHHLYPAMPYPSYAKMTPEDIEALYLFFMRSVRPVRAPNRPSEMSFPLNWRWPLAIWNSAFANTARYKTDPRHDDRWNRGAYLVQGPGHCGACHTPRGWLFMEQDYGDGNGKFLMGARLDNWSASNLRSDVNTGLGRWSRADVMAFLKSGHNSFGTAFGTMTEVINNSTQYLSDADIDSMAIYLLSLTPAREGNTKSLLNGRLDNAGAAIYRQHCKACHLPNGKGVKTYLSPLAGNPAVVDPAPESVINVVINGSMAVVIDGLPDTYRMPKYRLLLTDQQVADVVSYIRATWGNSAPGVSPKDVVKVREATDPVREPVQILRMK